jgi:hypothetical protein
MNKTTITMKNIHTIIKKVLFTLLAVFIVQSAVTQNPIVKIDYNGSGLIPGSSIGVPIIIDGNVNIGSVTLNFYYDSDYLTYVNTIAGPGFAPVYAGTWYVNPTTRRVALSWSSYPGITCTNQLFCTVNFTFNGGSGPLNFVTALCELSDELGNVYNNVTYINGSYSGAFGVITSVGAGGNWGTASTWDLNKVPTRAYNVFISAEVVTINETPKYNALTINSAGRLTLNSGFFMPSGAFLIQSGGSFVDNNTTQVITATVRRNITGNYTGGYPTPSTLWHYVSSPISNAKIEVFLGCLMNWWNDTAMTWVPLTLPITQPMIVGKGYAVASYPSFGTAIFIGPLNTGNQNITGLTNNGSGGISYAGWNLIGNAFPSAFIWNDSVTRTNVDAAIYLWNGSTYVSYVPADNYQVQAEQGFFVHATAVGSVMIPNSNRVHSSGSFLKSTLANNLELTAENELYTDRTVIRFVDGATEYFDGEHDAYKLFSYVDACPQIWSITPEDDLSINALPDLSVYPIIKVGFKAGETGTYTIKAEDLESFEVGTDLYLEDLITGTTQDLQLNQVYTFQAEGGSNGHRFNIHFAPLGQNENEIANIKIYSVEKDVFVNIPSAISGDIIVYNMLGYKVAQQNITGNSLNKLSLNTSSGYYLIKVVSNEATVSGKVFIR